MPLIGDVNCAPGLLAMDRWLAAVEQDTWHVPLAQKIIADKPADVRDQCSDGLGQVRSRAAGLRSCRDPVFGTPRTVAGEAIAIDTNKCQLKPLRRTRLLPDAIHRRRVGAAAGGLPDRRLRLEQARRRPAADDSLADLPGRARATSIYGGRVARRGARGVRRRTGPAGVLVLAQTRPRVDVTGAGRGNFRGPCAVRAVIWSCRSCWRRDPPSLPARRRRRSPCRASTWTRPGCSTR